MSETNQLKLSIMLGLQETMNATVNPDWKSAGYNWYRAIWLETAEAVEHTPWKWWKKGEPNIEQIKLELVDIWHFILSQSIIENHQLALNSSEFYGNHPLMEATELAFILEGIAHGALSSELEDINLYFFSALYKLDMSFDDLYKLYIAKNTLNLFRQANGYKTGGYIKIWNGLEDNEVLTNLLNFSNDSDPNFPNVLYADLEAVYATVKVG